MKLDNLLTGRKQNNRAQLRMHPTHVMNVSFGYLTQHDISSLQKLYATRRFTQKELAATYSTVIGKQISVPLLRKALHSQLIGKTALRLAK